MKKRFDEQNKLASMIDVLTSETGSVILANFLFLLTSIPIFTIGASALTLQKIIIDLFDGKKVAVLKTYFPLFKSNFKNGMKIFAIFLPIFAILSFASYFYILNVQSNSFFVVLSLLALLTIAVLVGVLTYLFAIIVKVDIKFTHAMKNAFVLYFGFPLRSLLTTTLTILLIGVFIFYLPYTLPLYLLLTFSFTSMVSTVIVLPMIEEHLILKV